MTETEHTESGGVDVAGLRGLLEDATPQPWRWKTDHLDTVTGEGGDSFITSYMGHIADVDADYDAALIAAAVNALPALLDELTTARERARVVEGERDALKQQVLEEWADLVSRMTAAETRAESAEAALASLRGGVEGLAEEYQNDAAREPYGGEPWTTTEARLSALLAADVIEEMEPCSVFGSHPRGGHNDAVLAADVTTAGVSGERVEGEM